MVGRMEHKMMILHAILFAIVSQIFLDYALARDALTFKRHSVKTIKTKYGDIYDCVDVYKQPALSHPLLKDHKVQMKPSSSMNFSSKNTASNNVLLEKVECPERTVPVRRDRYNGINKSLATKLNSAANSDTAVAGLIMKPNSGNTFTGASATIAIYNPKVEDEQISAALITIEAGSINNLDSIKVGWTVSPIHFHDTQTRFVTAWERVRDADVKGCVNTDCDLFIQTNHQYSLGAIFTNVSIVGKEQYGIPITLTLDSEKGAWWLSVYNNIQLGYWPAKGILDNLVNGANEIFMGGLVDSENNKLPPMGSGQPFKDDYTTNCYMSQVTIKQQGGSFVDPRGVSVVRDEHRCYSVGFEKYKEDGHGYVFVFGGEGGTPIECGE